MLRAKGLWISDNEQTFFLNAPDQLWLIEKIEERIKELRTRKFSIMTLSEKLDNYDINMLNVQIEDLKSFKEFLLKQCNEIEESEVDND